MEFAFTSRNTSELRANGYKDLGIFTQFDQELKELKDCGKYDEILLHQIDPNGTIFRVFVKEQGQ